jgi:hypothetical protein
MASLSLWPRVLVIPALNIGVTDLSNDPLRVARWRAM